VERTFGAAATGGPPGGGRSQERPRARQITNARRGKRRGAGQLPTCHRRTLAGMGRRRGTPLGGHPAPEGVNSWRSWSNPATTSDRWDRRHRDTRSA
jgi:hypothetical protein